MSENKKSNIIWAHHNGNSKGEKVEWGLLKFSILFTLFTTLPSRSKGWTKLKATYTLLVSYNFSMSSWPGDPNINWKIQLATFLTHDPLWKLRKKCSPYFTHTTNNNNNYNSLQPGWKLDKKIAHSHLKLGWLMREKMCHPKLIDWSTIPLNKGNEIIEPICTQVITFYFTSSSICTHGCSQSVAHSVNIIITWFKLFKLENYFLTWPERFIIFSSIQNLTTNYP